MTQAIGQELGLELSVLFETRAYILPSADCEIGSTTFEPRQGDVIVEGTDNLTILPPDDTTAAVHKVDDNRWLAFVKT